MNVANSYLLIIIFATMGISQGTEPSASFQAESQILPGASFLFTDVTRSKIIDVGKVRPGQVYQFNLQLENDSGMNFQIEKINSGCGCLVGETEAKVIPNHESVDLSIRIKPKGDNSLWSQKIFVYGSKNRVVSPLSITVKARIVPEIMIDRTKVYLDPSDSVDQITVSFTTDSDGIDLSKCRFTSVFGALRINSVKNNIPGRASIVIDTSEFLKSSEYELAGQLRVTVPALDPSSTPRQFEFPIMLVQKGVWRLSPSLLTFSRAKQRAATNENESSEPLKWCARAVLTAHLSEDAPTFEADQFSIRSPDLGSVYGISLSSVRRAGSGYIIQLELTGTEPPPSRFSINVENPKHQMYFVSKCFVFDSVDEVKK